MRNIEKYQKKVERTRNFKIELIEEMKNYSLGLTSEVGELIGIFKHIIYHHWTINKEKLIEEMGDCLWYLTALASVCDLNIGDIVENNIKKLEERYPNGFSENDSINRKEGIYK